MRWVSFGAMCNREAAGEIEAGSSMLDLVLECLRSILVLLRRIIEMVCRVVESMQVRRRQAMAADWVRQEDGDAGQRVLISYEGISEEACSSSAERENQCDAAKVPRTVSSRVKYGKWNFYAVRRGRSVGIYGSWPECEKQVKYYSGAVYKDFNSEREAIAFMGYTDRL